MVMVVPPIVLGALHQEKYYLSVAFGALFTGLNDPGGEYGVRGPKMALTAVIGALLTALGFAYWGSCAGSRIRLIEQDWEGDTRVCPR